MADTTRDKFAAMREEMVASENAAMDEASELFRSDDMKTLLDKLADLKARAMPDSFFDNIMGSAGNVLTSIRDTFTKAHEQAEELKAQQAKAADATEETPAA